MKLFANASCKGRSQVETVVVLLLLVVLGSSVFALALEGSNAYGRLDAKKTAQTELRIASAYLQMKIRQYDVLDAIRIAPNPVNQKDSLVISEEIEGQVYETWVYCDEGQLLEAWVLGGTVFNNTMAFPIAQITGCELQWGASKKGLAFTLGPSGEQKNIPPARFYMALRSGGVR